MCDEDINYAKRFVPGRERVPSSCTGIDIFMFTSLPPKLCTPMQKGQIEQPEVFFACDVNSVHRCGRSFFSAVVVVMAN